MTDAFYGPRSRANAQALLEAARALGLDARVVRTTLSGYLVPEAVLAHMEGVLEIEEGTVYPEPVAPKRPQVTENKATWAAYATHLGLEVTEDTTKADLIDMVKTAEAGKEND
jgi:hypothetical protein